ncbi:histidine kinase dimerization/phosphoacceptor domain-containing protein [Curtobacterium flaccumfaciens]|nr:histidine kinase dimerization/phosphoacceptor domain-containing protein [Curtobacterium flaccumfaciens]
MTDRRTFLRPLATRSIAVDVAWAALAAFVFLLPIDLELEHASLAAVLSASVAIALRRISPSAAMAMVVVLGVIQVGGGERPSLVDLAMFVVIGTAAVVGTRTEVVVSGVLAVVAGAGATVYLASTGFRFLVLINGPRDQAFLAMAAPVTALLGVWAGGVAVRAFRSRDRESERRADAEAAASRAEAVATEAEATATRAIDVAESERIRADIARDVHDVVGHSLAVIIAQADSVPFLDDEARIRAVSATIASTARSSLVEVRQVLRHIDGSRRGDRPGVARGDRAGHPRRRGRRRPHGARGPAGPAPGHRHRCPPRAAGDAHERPAPRRPRQPGRRAGDLAERRPGARGRERRR